MLSKETKKCITGLATRIFLGRITTLWKKAPVINVSNMWDTDETLASAEVKGTVRENRLWHPANELASQLVPAIDTCYSLCGLKVPPPSQDSSYPSQY
ncbi:hypothetical protein Tco_0968131 [Tanacetum coccineum]